jgi:hypothetical protein
MHKYQYALFGAIALLLASNAHAASEIWQDVTPAQVSARGASEIRYFQANDSALRSALDETSSSQEHQIRIPMPDGKLATFRLKKFPVMAPELAAKYPGIKTFRVFGVDDPQATGVIDITPLGFHGMIETSAGSVFIDPEDFRLQDHIYRTRFARHETRKGFNCGVTEHARNPGIAFSTGRKTAQRVPGSLLEYRLAVAVTLEYYQLFGDDLSTTSAIATTIARVNFVYARDHGILLTLVANNDEIYESVDSGLLDNEDEFQLLGQVNNWIDTRLTGGDGAYDIGHMFSRPALFGGGVANIGAVCDNSLKAGGVSGLNNPTGDPFNIDLVAHEIGHQFNAEHSFNGTTSSCVNRNAGTAYEPGSGSTIMAYAGICVAENLQTNSDVSFHAGSIAEVNAFTAGAGSCYNLNNTPPAPIPAPNADPVITAIANTTIPANTPFLLGDPGGPPAATDVDLDTLEYRWDQMDAGCPTDDTTFGTDNGSNALFRSYAPRGESWRDFPALGTQVLGRYDKAEVLPCHDRVLDFRLTATDGNSGQDFEDIRVSVNAAAGPFEITSVAAPIVAGTAFAVDWDVAGTDLAPVSCANVDIDLIVFSAGKLRYSIYPLALDSSANDGSALATVNPAEKQTKVGSTVRVRVKCSDNIFYDISDTDLTVTQGIGPTDELDDDDFATRSFTSIGITEFTAPACGPIVDCSTPPPTGNTGSGGRDASAFSYAWLLLLGSLAALRRVRCCQG